jgi:hypothetical protein
MSNQDLILYGGIATTVLVIALYLIYWYREKKSIQVTEAPASRPAGESTLNLRLQAYERLVMLAERISLPSLITRIPAGDLTVRQYQGVLIDQIKTEFDYNLSQQIYVAAPAWQAINNLKEQNIFIINQIGQALPAEIKGNELSRKIADLLNADPRVSLHPMVLEALNYEAKKLL